jgi:hypothetical protein
MPVLINKQGQTFNNTMEDDTMETNYEMPAKKKAKRTRKIKPLPEELVGLKDCATDWEKFSIAKEADANNKVNTSAKSWLLLNLFL